jgi:hypothetical protein
MIMKIKVGHRLGLFFLLLLAFSVSTHAQGYEADSILMYDDIDPITSAPVGLGEIYFTHSGYAYCWVNLTDVYESHVMRFDWRTPSGELHASHSITTDSPAPGQHFPLYVVFDNLEIQGGPPATNPGQWTVKAYVDDNLIGTRQFTIIDYNAIMEKTYALESQVAEIVSSFEQFISNYESMQDLYEELLSDYNELLDTYDDLTISYEDQISDYNEILTEKNTLQEGYGVLNADFEELVQTTSQLTDEYNELINDYEAAATRLSNSKNMTYASVALAVVFLAAAIYLYTKK